MRRLLLLAAFVHVADILLTYLGMQRGMQEGNPIAAYLMQVIGFWTTCFLLKTVAMSFTYLLLQFECYEAYWAATGTTFILGPLGWALLLLLV